MKTQQLAVLLTGINFVLLFCLLGQNNAAVAQNASAVAPVLRGRSLEIVDDQGRRRAELIITAPTTAKDGKKYPETVLFRLIDPNGRPGVKIGTSEEGSGMSVAGDSERRDWNGIQILAEANGTSVKLTNKDGQVKVIKP